MLTLPPTGRSRPAARRAVLAGACALLLAAGAPPAAAAGTSGSTSGATTASAASSGLAPSSARLTARTAARSAAAVRRLARPAVRPTPTPRPDTRRMRPPSRPASPTASPTAGLPATPHGGWAEGPQLVVNPELATGTSGWTVAGDAAGLSSARTHDVGPGAPAPQALAVTRGSATGRWAYALAALRSPASSLVVGRTYRMQVWVRDLTGTAPKVTLLVADGNHRGRPAQVAEPTVLERSGWRLLSRTFVASSPALGSTGLYLGLPRSGALSLQVTGASLRAVDAPAPARVAGDPTRVLSFDGPAGAAPDAAVWTTETGGLWGRGKELQSYTASRRNAALDGRGNLVITARRETTTGRDGVQRAFSSARLTSMGKVAVPAGSYVEADITAPVGAGVWPAFWTLGSDHPRVGWPASGELDVLEVKGARPDVVLSATHMGRTDDPSVDHPYGWEQDDSRHSLGHSADAVRHTYGVYFDGRTVRYYVDRRLRQALWADDAAASGRSWPFAQSHALLLNIAIDSAVTPETAFPVSMTVSGIRVWSGGVPF